MLNAILVFATQNAVSMLENARIFNCSYLAPYILNEKASVLSRLRRKQCQRIDGGVVQRKGLHLSGLFLGAGDRI